AGVARVRDALEAFSNPATWGQVGNSTFRFGNYGRAVFGANFVHHVSRSWQHPVPVARRSAALDQCGEQVIFPEAHRVEQLRTVSVPVVVIHGIGFGAQFAGVELVLGGPLGCVELFGRGADASLLQRREHALQIGENERITRIKEDGADHKRILRERVDCLDHRTSRTELAQQLAWRMCSSWRWSSARRAVRSGSMRPIASRTATRWRRYSARISRVPSSFPESTRLDPVRARACRKRPVTSSKRAGRSETSSVDEQQRLGVSSAKRALMLASCCTEVGIALSNRSLGNPPP